MDNCKHIKENGESCKAPAMNDGSGFCYWHNPAVEVARSQARSRGASAHKLSVTLDEPQIKALVRAPATPADVTVLLSNVLQAVLSSGQISPRSAASIAYVAERLMKSMEQSQLSDKIERLEAKLEGLNGDK